MFSLIASGIIIGSASYSDEFREMVNSIRIVEEALGSGIKKVSEVEIDNSKVARKSIVAKRDIVAGEVFTLENIDIKRPGTGISPMRIYEIIGTTSQNNYKIDDLIKIHNG